jgi:hypothetical protein
MKHVLGFLGILLLGLLLLNIASPAKGQAVVSRIVHFADPVPPPPAFEGPAGPPAPAAIGVAPNRTPPWRLREREGDRSYAAGEFLEAYRAFAEAASKAPPGDQMRLRARADRANIYRLLASEITADPAEDPTADEAEYRRRIDALKGRSGAGAFLTVADFAASRGLTHHLAYLYEMAFERKTGGEDEVQQKVTKLVKKIVEEKKAEGTAAPTEVLESLIREMPTSEAADIARTETGDTGGPGLAGTEQRGASGNRGGDAGRMAEAFKLFRLGDAEYRQAVPGSRDVNKHRRAALDAYTQARAIFEAIDRASGSDNYQKEIHDCNRNIAELRKDLPIGK